MCGADLDVEVRIANGVANLLESAAGSEHRKGARKGNATGGGNARSHAHQVGLGDTGVEEAIGIGRLELCRLGSSRQVGIEYDKVVVLGTQLDQGLTIARASGDSLHVCHYSPSLS